MKNLKKVLSWTLLLSMILIVLAGCAKNGGNEAVAGNNAGNQGNAGEGATSSEAAPEEKKLKDTLTWAQSGDVFSFDPNIGKETVALQTTGNIYDTLFIYNTQCEIVPMLATEWEQVDAENYIIRLREGVKFHDGSDFTAEDAKYSLERASVHPFFCYLAKFIDHVDVFDDYTIQMVTTEGGFAPAIRYLTFPAIAMMSKEYAEANGEEILTTAPMGTGPFKFVEWKPGNYVKLERFDEYWNGPAAMKNLVMRVIPEAAQRTIALETGEVDLAYDILPNDIDRIENTEGFGVAKVSSLMCYYIGMNFQNQYLADQRVREAIRLTIDPAPMIASVLYGAAREATTVVSPEVFGFQPDVAPIAVDVEKAKQLMSEAGYADGFDLSITVSEYQERIEMCQIMQEQLKAININLSIDVVEQSTYVETVNRGAHELCFQNWTTATLDADNAYFALYHSSRFGSQGGRVFAEIPGMDAILEAAQKCADTEERIKLYGEAEALVQKYSVNRPLIWVNLAVGVSNNVEGFEMMPTGYHKLYTVKVYE